MALDFLRSIEHVALPLRIDDADEIRCVRILRAARLIEAVVKEASGPGEDDFVLIEKITWQGRSELARWRHKLQA